MTGLGHQLPFSISFLMSAPASRADFASSRARAEPTDGRISFSYFSNEKPCTDTGPKLAATYVESAFGKGPS
jgi:hypothetical protein